MAFERSRSLLGVVALLLPSVAAAHLAGIPTIAWFEEPADVGTVVDGEYTFRWKDYDDTEGVVGNTLIDFFYTSAMPPTYRMGSTPSALVGTPIVKGIPEADLDNAYVWDTSGVPAGTYFLWSMAHDAPFKMVAFSRGAITVAHEGDPIHPAITITDPDGDGHVSQGAYVIRYQAFDPDGSGRVRLEASSSPVGADRILLADDLAPAEGAWEWDTTGLEAGDWSVFARIEDGRGLSHEAWGRFFIRVNRQDGEGGSGGHGGSAGSGWEGEGGLGGGGGTAEGPDDLGTERPEGCACGSAGAASSGAWLTVLPLLLWRRRSSG